MESEDIFNLPELRPLGELEERQAQITQKIESGAFTDEQIKLAYLSAREVLQSQIIEEANGELLQNSLVAVGETALRGIEELKPLEEILPTEQIAPLRDEYDARLLKLSEFFETYGPATEEAKKYIEKVSAMGYGVSTEVEVAPVPELAETADGENANNFEIETSSEQEKQQIRIRIGENSVQIGRRGSIFRFATKAQGIRDYSAERRRALIYLLSHEGEEVTGAELMEAAYGGERLQSTLAQRRNMSTRVRAWIQNVPTYKRSPLIQFNGKRGSGSCYTTHPSYSFNVVYDDSPQLDEKPAGRRTRKTSTTITEAEQKREPSFIPQESDFYLTAHHLAKFNSLLERSNMPMIDDEMLDELEPYAPDLSDLRGNDEAIKAYRLQALERVKVFLDDETRLFSFLDTTAQNSAEYRFINFISGLDEQERDFIDQLFRARLHTDPQLHHGLINGTETKIIDEAGNEILPLVRTYPNSEVESEEKQSSSAKPHQVEDQADEELDAKDLVINQPQASPEALPHEDEIIKCLDEATARLIEHNIDPSKVYPRHIIQKAIPNFTISRTIGIKERLGKKRSDSQWNLEEVYLTVLMRDKTLQNIVNAKRNKKAVKNLIDTEIEKLAKPLKPKQSA